MKLYNIAHSRAGDKGNKSMISVIAYKESDFPYIEQNLTESKVYKHFKKIGVTCVERYELPQLGALNFVLHNSLGGGVTHSLAIDTHGKSYSSYMLEIEI